MGPGKFPHPRPAVAHHEAVCWLPSRQRKSGVPPLAPPFPGFALLSRLGAHALWHSRPSGARSSGSAPAPARGGAARGHALRAQSAAQMNAALVCPPRGGARRLASAAASPSGARALQHRVVEPALSDGSWARRTRDLGRCMGRRIKCDINFNNTFNFNPQYLKHCRFSTDEECKKLCRKYFFLAESGSFVCSVCILP